MQVRTSEQTAALTKVLGQLAEVKRQAVVGPFVLKVSQRKVKLHTVARGACSIPPAEWTTA